MSHMTADLEYFKCDMCGVYMHRDIFCDHRRDCHGLGSTQLKRGECQRIAEALGRETRELLLRKDGGGMRAASSSQGSTHTQTGAACTTTVTAGERKDLEAHAESTRYVEGAAAASSGHVPLSSSAAVSSVRAGGAVPISLTLSTKAMEKRQEARTRRAVSDRYQAGVDAKISSLLTEGKKAALLDFLNS
ncbi:conserved hypothetical protein [Leishmania infantum JPCM5]|uniref:Uncharacterized protein n=3 Tax=Leishmania donovani species complex TaxID=38574 RepID=A4HST2_LEIIN|nr:conserved hypothetical protein [Leishmania infantum JPCM5]AYU76072.1 hypothetical protein LdCL_060009300 [Leishmania donovani]CAC9445677.1 hypothetical_protein_-_conserved [Leishmania infantum]CAM65473.1 conserved hypothetical protein [Leishmania infantum JPCM5]SUZ39088.1 hypothetical_protein_-_conserved [Leishmania infantum]|eukprot:XP_001463123.1 conserved hypothetical protein [Leishmania infantum JPCM5]